MEEESEWGFYGRESELENLKSILDRKRWFFVRITGRRRIGKTSLIQQALKSRAGLPKLYVQIPDSGPAGVLSAFGDALSIFDVAPSVCSPPKTLAELAQRIARLVEQGFVVVLDEFQYFSRKRLVEFNSYLQAQVDRLASATQPVRGGLVVLGSIHAELMALIENRDAPLYNRTTDAIELEHLDIESLLALLHAHCGLDLKNLLFLWSIFEGVPKFYRDAYEQGALGEKREVVLKKMFFRSSSPLRSEAENWFLHELRGQYDVVLNYIARHPGCSQAELTHHVQELSSSDNRAQVGAYIKGLIDKFGLVEKRLPIFDSAKSRKGRYYIKDNFLRAWLDALGPQVRAVNFRPEADLVHKASDALVRVEGHAFERLVARIYEERSRKSLGDFRLTHAISGYWNRKNTEIDFVALDEDAKILRLASCKRSPKKLVHDIGNFGGHVERFLESFPRYQDWKIERVGISVELSEAQRKVLSDGGILAEDLGDLLHPFKAYRDGSIGRGAR